MSFPTVLLCDDMIVIACLGDPVRHALDLLVSDTASRSNGDGPSVVFRSHDVVITYQ